MKKNFRDFAKNPPMGWNSWDCYGAAVNEEQLLGNAHYMAEHMKEFGWEYVVCDIQWYEPDSFDTDYTKFAPLCIDEYSRVIPAEKRFPSAAGGVGFKKIADEIHSLGLKFGIHIMRGIPRHAVHARTPIKTHDGRKITADMIASPSSICAWNSDMYGVEVWSDADAAQDYYDSIIELYAGWGVDFIKVDDIACLKSMPNSSYAAKYEIEMIRKAIDKCGREIVLSLSPGPAEIKEAWHLSENANMWRLTDDVWDHWGAVLHMFERCEVWQNQVQPGTWPDCDMLPFGHLKVNSRRGDNWCNMTHDEQLSMMNLWSIFRSPLMVGAELRDNDGWTLNLLTNSELLRLNKHSFGAKQIKRNRREAVWFSFDGDGSYYAALFNISDEEKCVSVSLDELGLDDAKYTIRDLWKHEDIGTTTDVISAEIPSHGSVIYKISL